MLLSNVLAQVVQLDWRERFGCGRARSGKRPAAGVLREDQLPLALSEGEGPVDGVVDEALAHGSGFAFERGQQADTVLCGILRKGLFKDISHGGEPVVEAGELLVGGIGRDMAGPARQKRDVVAPVEDVRLVAAEDVVGVVSGSGKLGQVGLVGAPVVAGHHKECVLPEAGLIQRIQNRPKRGVGLHYEIRVGADAAFALPFR